MDTLLSTLRGIMPEHDFTRHDPPALEQLAIGEPRVVLPTALAPLGSHETEDRAGHAHGKGLRDVLRNLHGTLPHVPDLVVRPETEADVVAVLDWCTESGTAVVPYGGGSSVVGGIEPRFEHPAVCLDLGRLNRVLEVDDISRAARIQAGALGPHLEDQLRPTGLTLRFFPQSFEFSTLGGWLATRAGGHFATGFTHAEDYCESMRVVTPIGVSSSFRLPASGAGISPDRFFAGSEGSLGVITEAWMRLQDRPVHRARASVHFEDFSAALAATRAIAQSNLRPANCRLLDPSEALINAGALVGGGVLVLAFESAHDRVDDALAAAVSLCRDHGGTVPKVSGAASAPAASDTWKSSFIRMPYQRDALARHSVMAETFETSMTWDRMEHFIASVQESARAIVQQVTGTPGIVTCRLTHVYPDGAAPYFGIYAPGSWDGIVSQWDEMKAAVSETLHTLGGTITHHHAVGRDHRPWYDRQRPDVFAAAVRGAKSALDPAGILNPGIMVD